MKKYLAVACLLLMCLVASLFGYSRSGQDKKTCIDACKKDHDGCLAKTPETDPQKEEARKQVCHDSFKSCVDKCG